MTGTELINFFRGEIMGTPWITSIPFKIKFFQKIHKSSSYPCWIWTGARNKINGYGKFRTGPSKTNNAHVVSWRLHFGEVPSGLWVLHKCDIPHCVNPEHLWLGTHLDNMQDMAKKGRSRNKWTKPRCPRL